MPGRFRLLVGMAAVAFAGAACRTKGTAGPSASASAKRPAPSLVAPLPSAPLETPEVSLCRVIARRQLPGAPPDAGSDVQAPAVGTALEGREWVELGAGTEVALRHALTTRELALRGPGRFLPCFLGTETVLVARGAVKTTAGAGARAGAEVILATPIAVVHFADAALELRVGERAIDVTIEAGVATLVPASAPKTNADAGSPDVVLGPRSKKRLSLALALDVEELIGRCRDASSGVASGPPPVAAGAASARVRLGEWSVLQLKSRQTARWACAAARAAVGRQEGPERTRLWDLITATDRVWQAPRAPTDRYESDAGK